MVIWWECKCQHIITHTHFCFSESGHIIDQCVWLTCPSDFILCPFCRESLRFVVTSEYIRCWHYLRVTDRSLYFIVIHCTATRGSRTYLTWMDLFHYCRPFISCNQAYLNWTRTIFCPSDSWTAAKPPQFLLVDFLHVFVTDGVSETTDTVSYWLHWILPRTTTAEL